MNYIEYTRAAKMNNLQYGEDFTAFHRTAIKDINHVIKFIVNKFQSGEFVDIVGKKTFILRDGSQLTQAEFNKKYWTELFGNLSQKGNKGKARDQITAYCVERICANANRNKKKFNNIKNPRIHDSKSLYIKSATVIVSKDTLTLKTYTGEDIDIPFSSDMSYGVDLLMKDRAKTGGNFHVKQKTFVAQLQKHKKPLYEPEDFLGFDINLADGQWLVFSKDHEELKGFLNRPEDIHDLIVHIKDVNKVLSDKRLPVSERQYRTNQRRKQRRVWQGYHKKLNKLIRKIAQQIIDVCIKNKYCLCIDNLASGDKNGTFGQDHLVELLKTMCEDQSIPFYSIPTPYTSMTCCECGHCDKMNRDKHTFACLNCFYTVDAHTNAAKNIANFGKKLYDAGIPYSRLSTYPKTWSVDTIIKKFQENLSSKKESLDILC